MLSIITSIYNQKAMNEIFYQTLVENTKNPFELIIVDNKSTDGSREFFKQQKNVTVIENDGNYNYPYCQNRGIEISKFNLVCFFNNDILVSKFWDEKILNIISENKKLNILSVATNDHLENTIAQRKISRKWKMIKYPLQFFFGNRKWVLVLMRKLMYGNFDKFCEKRFKKFGNTLIEGYSGSSIIAKKEFISSIGSFDETVQAGDFDLFNNVKQISLKNEDVMPINIALGIYFHHYQRLTLKEKYPPFKNSSTMRTIDQKWGDLNLQLRKDIIR